MSEKPAWAEAPAEQPAWAKKPEPEPTMLEKAGGLAYGAATGLLGGLGELEKFGAYTVPEALGLSDKEKRGTVAGRETIFPTTEEIEKVFTKFGIPEPSKTVGGYKTAGEIIGGFGTSPFTSAGKATVKAGKKVSEGISAAKKIATGERAPIVETANLAKDYGVKIPPQELAGGESGWIANTLRSITAKNALSANYSIHNAKEFSKGIRSDLGIPRGEPLTKARIKEVIAEESKPFEELKDHPIPFRADPEYLNDIASIGTSYSDAARHYPVTHGKLGADELRSELMLDKDGMMFPNHAVDNVRKLREKSSNYFDAAHADPKAREMGMVYRDAANAIEGLIERELGRTGDASLLKKVVDSREKIAKAYDAKAALQEATGTFDASHYADLFKKEKPLTGKAADLGRLAAAYPSYFKDVSEASGGIAGTGQGMTDIFGRITEATKIQPGLRGILGTRAIPWTGTKR